MTKKNESNDYTDITTRTDILVNDLNGNKHLLKSKDICGLSTIDGGGGMRYLLEYMKGGVKQEVPISEEWFIMLIDIMKTKGN